MKLLIVGATGGTGRELVTQALARGHEVTAFVRDARRLGRSRERPRVVVGDVLDPETVLAAVAGQDAVLSALGHKRWFYPNRILSRGTENLIDAMRKHGVRRLICETALGLGDAWWRLGLAYTLLVRPLILPFYFHDKVRQERAIRASGLDWTIVRPGALTDGAPGRPYRHGEEVGHWLWTVSVPRADVAAFMLDQLEDPRYLRRSPGIAR